MGFLDKISDDFQHGRGQKDGAHGKLFGTSGDGFSKKYKEGYDAGRFDYEKKKYGETIAKGAKAERDFAKRISKGGKKSRKTDTRDYGDSGGSFDYEDRHYHGYDPELSTGAKWFLSLVAIVILGTVSSLFLNNTIKRNFPSKEVKKVWNLEYTAKYGGWERHIAADYLKKCNGKYDSHPYIKYVKEKRKEELTKMWNKKSTLEYLSQFKDPKKRKKAEQWLITYYDAIYGANCKDLAPGVRLRCYAAVNQLKFQGKTKPSGVMY